MFERKLYKSLKEHLERRQITVITGMRRTGKTTIVKKLLSDIPSKNKLFIDLERVDNREIFREKNYEIIVQALRHRSLDITGKVFLALDEIQLVPALPSVLKYLYDHYDFKFLLTGSSSFYIKNLFTESLAGRKKIFELFPLDFGEFLVFKGEMLQDEPFLDRRIEASEYERLKGYYEEYIQYGGFPEVAITDSTDEKADLLSDIISSYINIDVKSLADFRDQDNLYRIMRLCASRCGSRIDYMKLSKIAGLSRNTVHTYLDFLEKTYILTRIPVISHSPDREIVKAPKLYFNDNGLMNSVAELSGGAQFENAVFTQLQHKGSLSYYAQKTGREIDFILNGRTALEVKESPIESDARGLQALSSRARVGTHLLVGRYRVPSFSDYLWGGDIR